MNNNRLYWLPVALLIVVMALDPSKVVTWEVRFNKDWNFLTGTKHEKDYKNAPPLLDIPFWFETDDGMYRAKLATRLFGVGSLILAIGAFVKSRE
jgi:hypothetical protein